MMLNEKDFPFLAEKRHIISLVGGGGKTTLLHALAKHCACKGWRVLVTTTTHILQPANGLWAQTDAQLAALWGAGNYAVVGAPAENGKLTMLPEPRFSRWMAWADIVLAEADGAKHFPCKAPAAHEPVLLPQSDIVLAVAGLSALGKSDTGHAGSAAVQCAGRAQTGGKTTVLCGAQPGGHSKAAAAGTADPAAFAGRGSAEYNDPF